MEHDIKYILYVGLNITAFDRLDQSQIFVDDTHCLITFVGIILIISHIREMHDIYMEICGISRNIDISDIFMDVKSNIDI